MLHKTKGIILHQIKYTDSGVIAQVYTHDFGRLSIMIKGMRSRKSGKHNVLFQPMFILDLIFYYRESRGIQVLKEFSVSYSPAEIYADIKKSCIAVFLAEILTSVLKEESPNFELFDYIEDSIKYLDKCDSGFANFHIAFLIGLSSFLGFEPGTRDDPEKKYFDLLNGTFVSMPPLHSAYADPHVSDILAEFFKVSFDQMRSIPLTGSLRNEVLETIIRYFSIHLPGLKKVNSLDILKEIFI
ncbi:MAG: DNA repair protein RecO [Bacteroidia bacterium]|nr:DNA repair protein RecO [Bacteroidia bacterium]